MLSESESAPLGVGWLRGNSSAGDASDWNLEQANDSARASAGGVESSCSSKMLIQASTDWDCGVALDSKSVLLSLWAGLAVRLHNKPSLLMQIKRCRGMLKLQRAPLILRNATAMPVSALAVQARTCLTKHKRLVND